MEAYDPQQVDLNLRDRLMSLCAPVWWESGRQTVIHSGSMCVIQTPDALFGVTNNHVLAAYEHDREHVANVFGQLGSAPFDMAANLISRNDEWDLATFTIPPLTLEHFNHVVWAVPQWPPRRLEMGDHVVFGGYPESRRSVPPGPNPPTMTADFVSFRRLPHNTSPVQVSFQLDPTQVTWLPNVRNPLELGADVSGMSGGPCFRIIPEENRIELAAFIYEGRWDWGMFLARHANLISSTGQIAAVVP